jgi:hypothetical protein
MVRNRLRDNGAAPWCRIHWVDFDMGKFPRSKVAEAFCEGRLRIAMVFEGLHCCSPSSGLRPPSPWKGEGKGTGIGLSTGEMPDGTEKTEIASARRSASPRNDGGGRRVAPSDDGDRRCEAPRNDWWRRLTWSCRPTKNGRPRGARSQIELLTPNQLLASLVVLRRTPV